MGIFERLFGRKEKTQKAIPAAEKAAREAMEALTAKRTDENAPSIILAMSQLAAPDAREFTAAFGNLKIGGNEAEVSRLTQDAEPGTNASLALVKYGPHRIRMLSLDAPAPVLDHTLQTSHFPPEIKQPIADHKAHIIGFYLGDSDDPTEKLLALFCFARAFANKGLLGVLNEDAMNCIPANGLEAYTEPDVIANCREMLPPFIFTNVVQFFREDGQVWLCSKGHHLFGVPDVAWLAPEMGHMEKATQLFSMLFEYMYRHGAKIKPGETAEMGKLSLRFSAPTEYAEYLTGPMGTLVVEFV